MHNFETINSKTYKKTNINIKKTKKVKYIYTIRNKALNNKYDNDQMIINKEANLIDKNNLKNLRPYNKINKLFISYKMEYYNKNIFWPNNLIYCGKKFY